MAMIAHITRDDQWYLGEDKILRFAIYTTDALATAVDVSGMALSWKLATGLGVTATLSKATGGSGVTVSGIFDASPSVNTQRIEVSIADTDTDALPVRTWRHELKRTDAGLEAILVHGSAYLSGPVHLT